MTLIGNLNKTLYAIRSKLLGDDQIVKLLFHAVPNPFDEELTDPTQQQRDLLITLNPIVEYNTNPEQQLNNFISIGIPVVAFGSNTEGVIIRIELAIVCHVDYWQLNNNKMRLLSIVERIHELLDEQKFNLSGSFILESLKPEIFQDNLAGYRLSGYIMDSDLDIELE
jgi:hypothetical protein